MKVKEIHQKSSTGKRAFLFTVFLATVILSAGIAFFTKIGPFAVDNTGTNNTSNGTSSNEVETESNTTTSGTNKTPVNDQPTNDTELDKNTVAASVTYKQQDSAAVRIGTLIEAVASEGTCSLELTNGANTVTRTVGIQALSSTSTCKGFSIPTVELSAGTWNLKIDIVLPSKEAHLTDTLIVN